MSEKLKILIVEDNGMFLNIAEEMLEEHDVVAAKTYSDGMKQYKDTNPNIVFLDITLPDGNGHDFLKEVRKIDPDAYVVMLTASRMKDDVLRSMDEGAQGYIMKPFSYGILQQSLKEYSDYMNDKSS